MESQPLAATLDIHELYARFIASIQSLADTVKVLETGIELVDQQNIENNQRFIDVRISPQAPQPVDELRVAAQKWIQTHLLQDIIDRTQAFLRECLSVCEMLKRFGDPGKAVAAEIFNATSAELWETFDAMSMPRKLDLLATEYGFDKSCFINLLSLNRLRNCLVHRSGVVADKDVNSSNGLLITLTGVRMVLRDEVTGEETVLADGKVHLDRPARVILQTYPREILFALHEPILLRQEDLADVLLSVAYVGDQCGRGISNYATSLGAVGS